MQFLHIVLAFLHLLAVASAPRAQATSGVILAPPNGAAIAPGAAFDFHYDGRADYGVSSFNYTVWLFTGLPTSAAPADTFATGYFFGRFSEANYPANPNPTNLAPSRLVMPDFSKNPGGFGIGASASNTTFYLTVLEEYATGAASVGFRISMTMNQITYNRTTNL